MFKTHAAEAFQPLIPDLTPAVVMAVNDSFYKVASEGLRTVTLMVAVMRPHLEVPVRRRCCFTRQASSFTFALSN
jgi:hypothetical protein